MEGGIIGLALRMYSNKYDEAFPHLDGAAGLELLRNEGFLENYQCYICPSTKIKCPKQAARKSVFIFILPLQPNQGRGLGLWIPPKPLFFDLFLENF